ncbi:universal stress protein [Modestobacter sp. NPDC049651]|uniref:universal stress protein n=1 Tax=unclassified Modestobacter TaxID=2643866 RepID=UPI003401D627
MPAPHPPRIVVGVSPTDDGDGPLCFALREAARRDATVLAVTVCPGPVAAPAPDPAEVTARREHLVTLVQRAVAATGVRGRTQVEVLAGPVTGVLLALGRDADLLVLGLHRDLRRGEGVRGERERA